MTTTVQVGNLLVENNGQTATLTQNGLPATALLVITLAKFFAPQDKSNPKVTKPADHVAQISYDYGQSRGAVQLTIHLDDSHPKLDFYHFHWKKPADLPSLQDSFNLGPEDTFWFGGSNMMDLEWPMRKNSYNWSEFVLGDVYQLTKTSGQERYWLSSKKVALTVPWNVPLWSAVVDGELQLQARITGSQFLSLNDHLEYTLTMPKDEFASGISLKDFHKECFNKFLRAPTAHPDLEIMKKPIWSTWANFWTNVDQKGVEDYGRQIQEHGFPVSQLELDDMWTTKYGDYEIDTSKFANFSGMVQRLREDYGVPRLTAWVHPFVNADSKNGRDLELRHKIFVKTKRGDVPLSWWWDCPVKPKDRTKPVGPDNEDQRVPCGYVLDLTNPDAREWWHGQLKRMQEEGIYTFKFDAGENNWLPEDYTLHSGSNPNNYGQDYAFFAARFGPAVENRYGAGSQQANIFMRTMDRNSFWDKEGGLFTLIPWALQASLHGYFWNLPDMVGGNGLNHNATNIKGEPPEPELYIRWTQANAFLLAMQFSYPPWHPNYGSEVVENVKNVLAIREKWMPYILECVKAAVKDKEPVIRPMWWESDDPAAFGCRDQYMVGRDLVVAPVIERGQTKRNVFLPAGIWRDGNNPEATPVTGPWLIKEYKAPLPVVPFFYRDSSGGHGGEPSGNSAPALLIFTNTFTSLVAMAIAMTILLLQLNA